MPVGSWGYLSSLVLGKGVEVLPQLATHCEYAYVMGVMTAQTWAQLLECVCQAVAASFPFSELRHY
jgi:hypothetical protein